MSIDGWLIVNDGNIKVTTTGSRYGQSSGGGGWPGGGGTSSSDKRSSPKGIKVDGNITINGGTITVSATGGEGAEGIESKIIMTINGGYVEVTSYDDALNSSSHMYLKGGYVEEGLDANSEGGYKVYIQSGANLMVIGGNMGAIESGASLGQTCYQGTVSANKWIALYSGSNVAFAAYTPTFSNQGGMGPGGGGSTTSKTIVVTAPSTPKLYTGVTASGTTFWTGKGATNATGGSQVSLSSYSGGGGWGPW